jgi:hypothetical protein
MQFATLLSTIVLVTFLITVIMAVGSYVAYKLREGRRPPTDPVSLAGEPAFFERVSADDIARAAQQGSRDQA